MTYKPHPDAEARRRSAVIAVKGILKMDLYRAHKRELLTICLWKLTEAGSRGKYNLRFQTPVALQAPRRELQHEHVYQRHKVVQALLENPDDVDAILHKVVACTVTREEHARLTELSRQHPDLSGWERYRAAEIEVIDMKTEEKVSETDW